MENETQIELIIDSNNQDVVNEIKDTLKSLKVDVGKPSREIGIVTVLAITASSLKIINELLTLQEKIKERKKQNNSKETLEITARNEDGESINVENATLEKLNSFLQSKDTEEEDED